MPCSHGKEKSRCKDCGGSGICSHGKRKSRCIDCGGSGLCPHGKEKSKCKDCGGSGICSHGKLKAQCIECCGSGICSHGKQKSKCIDCGGSSICSHGRIKCRCKDCLSGLSLVELQKKNLLCQSCHETGTFYTFCAHCIQAYKKNSKSIRSEALVAAALNNFFPGHNYNSQTWLGGKSGKAQTGSEKGKGAYPDFVFEGYSK